MGKLTKNGFFWGRKPGHTTPEFWKSGPDLRLHSHYRQFTQARNQAKFRNEIWKLSFEDWVEKYGDNLDNRGRASHQYFMKRIDSNFGWTIDNVVVMQNMYKTTHRKKQ